MNILLSNQQFHYPENIVDVIYVVKCIFTHVPNNDFGSIVHIFGSFVYKMQFAR